MSNRQKKSSFIIFAGVVCLLFLFFAHPKAYAQKNSPLTINLIRNLGSATGSGIKGTFTIRANGPDNLESVTFYLDDTSIGTITEPPFNLKFNTDNYPPGTHTITAVGITSNNQELQSNRITRTFLTASENVKSILFLIVPLIILIVVGRFIANRIANRGQKPAHALAKIDGPQGGAICPKCYKPFARHWWAPNFVSSKYDRCPHCHKWSMVTRQSPELLQAALEALGQADALAQADAETSEPAPPDNENVLKRHLDDSRFDA